MFGVELDDNSNVLPVIAKALDWLEKHHLDAEGLWRTSGSKTEIAKLQAVADQTSTIPLDSGQNPHNVTNLLVRFMECIPGGLVGSSTATELLASGSMLGKSTVFIGVTHALFEILNRQLTGSQRELLGRLLQHWQRVVDCEENRMEAKAVATCVFAAVFAGSVDLRLILVLESLITAPKQVPDQY